MAAYNKPKLQLFLLTNKTTNFLWTSRYGGFTGKVWITSEVISSSAVDASDIFRPKLVISLQIEGEEGRNVNVFYV